jgi:ABC-type lipoprotein release transport system permease subunit
VILISSTSAAIGSFVMGIKPTEFFLGEEKDVLAITAPEASTPFTGSVPLSLTHEVQKLVGVKIVSPEVLGLVVAQNLNDRAIIVRGITPEFLNITQEIELDGKWFDQLSENAEETITSFGAVIGSVLALNQDLQIGSKLTLVGTLTPMTIELTIGGILTTGTPIDSELILPLTTAQALTGKTSDDVSLVKVKVDPTILTKNHLVEILTGEYFVPVVVQSLDPAFDDNLNEIQLMVTNLAGEVKKTEYFNQSGRITVELPFGTYRFIAVSTFTEQSTPVEEFVSQSIAKSINLWIGKPRNDLIVNVTYNNEPAVNATVTVQEKFRPTVKYHGIIPSSGILSFNLTENYYNVKVNHKNLSKKYDTRVNTTREVRIALENSLKLPIFNATNGEELVGGSIQLLNASNPTQVLHPVNTSNNDKFLPYDSRDTIYVEDPGTYLVNYSLGNRVKTWQQTILSNTSKTIYLGEGELVVKILDTEWESLEGSNVTISLDENYLDHMITDENGISKFVIETGDYYEIVAENPQTTRNKSLTIYFNVSMEKTLSFSQTYWLEIETYNGTTEDQVSQRLAGCSIILYNSSGIVNGTVTNNNGTVRIFMNQQGEYSLNTTYNDFSWHTEINITQPITRLKVPLGNVKLKVSAQTTSKLPIAGTRVKIFSQDNLIKDITTDDQGEVTVFVPLGNYTVVIEKIDYQSLRKLSFMKSQIYLIEDVFDLAGTLMLKVVDTQGKVKAGAQIVLENIFYGFTVTGIANQHAEIMINDLPWGNYSIVVVYRDALYEEFKIEFVEQEERIVIELTMPSELFSNTIYFAKYRNSVNIGVVESGEFLSGFLISTLQVAQTVLIALVVVVASLSLLSVSSVISYPIVTNRRKLRVIKTIGGSDQQLYIMIVCQLAIIGLSSSVFGTMIGLTIMTQIDYFQTTNIGGLIIRPVFNVEIMLGIVISTILVILVTTKKTLNNYSKPAYTGHLNNTKIS